MASVDLCTPGNLPLVDVDSGGERSCTVAGQTPPLTSSQEQRTRGTFLSSLRRHACRGCGGGGGHLVARPFLVAAPLALAGLGWRFELDGSTGARSEAS